MDGRLHPSDYPSTPGWISTAVWENGQLIVTTTHMKQGVYSATAWRESYGKMWTLFPSWRAHDVVLSVEDPIFLEEPLVRTRHGHGPQ